MMFKFCLKNHNKLYVINHYGDNIIYFENKEVLTVVYLGGDLR